MLTICRSAKSNDLLGAEFDKVLVGFLEKPIVLLFGDLPMLLGTERPEVLIGTDCSESASSSPDDATEPLL